MAYLVYMTNSVQIVHDEKMEDYKKDRPAVLARFPLTEAEAKLTIDELKQIYPLIMRKAYDPEKLKIVHEGLDNLEADVKLAQARNHPQEARQEDLARLTAEAVMSNYGNTMAAVTALGDKLKTLTRGLEDSLRGLDETMKALGEFVARVNDTSHEVTAKIDHANAVATEIRQWADGMTAKLK